MTEEKKKCPRCDGTGEVFYTGPAINDFGFCICDKCNGTGEIELSDAEKYRLSQAQNLIDWFLDNKKQEVTAD